MNKVFNVCIIIPETIDLAWLEDLVKSYSASEMKIFAISFANNNKLSEMLDSLKVEHKNFEGEAWIDASSDDYDKEKNKRIFAEAVEVAKQLEKWKVDLIFTTSVINNIGAFAASIINKPHVWYIEESLKNHPNYKLNISFESIANFINSGSAAILYKFESLKEEYSSNYINRNSRVVKDPEEIADIIKSIIKQDNKQSFSTFLRPKFYLNFFDITLIVLAIRKVWSVIKSRNPLKNIFKRKELSQPTNVEPHEDAK